MGTFWLSSFSSSSLPIKTYNPEGKFRVLVTKDLPGERWLQVLTGLNCRVDVCTSEKVILANHDIKELIGTQCDGVIGQLTEDWGDELFAALAGAGGQVYSNYAVGYNNVDVPAGTRHNIAVGNTPGVLTETTAEIAAALTLAAARRVVEADAFMRNGKYEGWLPTLFVGNLLQRKTVGIIGAGRIGFAYAKMMVEGHKMNIVYYDMYQNTALESYFDNYSKFLAANGSQA